MAFFKFRKGPDDAASASVQPQSVEAIRQRAKYRLVGATVLVLIGVVGFPLLFDKQPRPIPVDTPIDIPDKNKVLPLVIPSSPTTSEAPVAATAPPVTGVANKSAAKTSESKAAESVMITESAEPPKTPATSDKKQALAQADKAQVAPKSVTSDSAKPAKPATSTVPAKPSEASRAQALLEGAAQDVKVSQAKAASAAQAPGEDRFVVQVGAFADATRAHEVRLKVEHAGMKTYTNVAETKDGKRIRVRVGPFASKAEAEKSADKIKKLGLPAALLTL